MFYDHEGRVGKRLTGEEVERLAKLPRVLKDTMFNERAIRARIPTFRFEHPNKHVVFNCKTLVHTFGDTLEEATTQHFGPANPAGRVAS